MTRVELTLDLLGEECVEAFFVRWSQCALSRLLCHESRPLLAPRHDDGLRQRIGEPENNRIGRAVERPVRKIGSLPNLHVM